jgi:hypothetical protein
MITTEYGEWLIDFNKEMKRKKCKFLLLVDNAPCHILVNLNNMWLEYLPPNYTDVQYMDTGIVESFKGHYRHQVRKPVECIQHHHLN